MMKRILRLFIDGIALLGLVTCVAALVPNFRDRNMSVDQTNVLAQKPGMCPQPTGVVSFVSCRP
jgi:hypothetical protein